MKARLIIGLAGDPMREVGEIVEGDEAIRFLNAGFAEPYVEEEVETADLPVKKETATRRKAK